MLRLNRNAVGENQTGARNVCLIRPQYITTSNLENQIRKGTRTRLRDNQKALARLHSVRSLNRSQDCAAEGGGSFAAPIGHALSEDGFIAHALEHLFRRGAEPAGWCFEVGAGDGRFYSNTLNLRRFGWRAVLIESDEVMFRRLCETFGADERILKVYQRIEPQGRCSLDVILRRAEVTDFDLGVIDIDGPDYECWKYLRVCQPKLMLVEYAPDDSESFPEAARIPEQRNAADTIALGIEKGYLPLVKTWCNLLFARKDVWTV